MRSCRCWAPASLSRSSRVGAAGGRGLRGSRRGGPGEPLGRPRGAAERGPPYGGVLPGCGRRARPQS
eukprot:1326453-Alexandrium_andersonii.AAC.1